MNIEGSRILVTGGSGLIGSHIVDLLVLEHPKEIIVFDKNVSGFIEHSLPKLDYKAVTLCENDITQPDEVQKALKEVDFVFHAASLLTKESDEQLRAAYEVNVGGMYNVLEGSVAAGVKKLIYSSSISIYGNPVMKPMTEEHPLNTVSMYGAGKVACEFLLRVFKNKFGLNYVALRYSPVYGSRQTERTNIAQYISESFARIEQNLPPLIYGDGSQLYDYIYVEDVARANIVALKSPVNSESFNIATGISTSVTDVVRMIREITGTSLEAEYVSQGDRFGTKNLFFDVTKAEKVLGYKAAVSMKEGLTRFYKWTKENEKYKSEE